MKSIYRKLKDYILEEPGSTTVIFGDLMSKYCIYYYYDENKQEWQEWNCNGFYYHEMDFLLNYYVRGITPMYKIEQDRIVSYLAITLSKERD